MKKIRDKADKVRKKYIPTFGEQHSKAKSEGKKTFKSTRDDTKKGNLEDIAKASDQLNLQALTIPVVKYFICYPK